MLCWRKLRILTAAFAAVVAALLPVQAQAAVEITFYSREFGSQFPHGFVTLQGTPERGGERIDTSYGFTATHVTPAVLFGSVRGIVEPLSQGYIRGSDAHFAVALSDAEYDRVVATVTRYEQLGQPSYNLNRRNCVHFIADVAAAIGLAAAVPRNLTRRPAAFIDTLVRGNRPWLTERAARILKEPAPERRERRERRRS